jgi:antitoxin PrlF
MRWSQALADRYQTTVPQPVRRALGLRKRDRIRYAFPRQR